MSRRLPEVEHLSVEFGGTQANPADGLVSGVVGVFRAFTLFLNAGPVFLNQIGEHALALRKSQS